MKITGLVLSALVAMSANSVDAVAPVIITSVPASIAQPRVTVRPRSQQPIQRPAVIARAQPVVLSELTEEEEFDFVDPPAANEEDLVTSQDTGYNEVFAIGAFVTAILSGAWLVEKKFRAEGTADEKKPIALNSINVTSNIPKVDTLLDVGKWMTETKQPYPSFVALAFNGKLKFPGKDKGTTIKSKVASKGRGVKVSDNKTYADIQAATKAGLVQGCAPFPDGVDFFGFFNGLSEAEAQRYADVEITHGRVCMLAALGFLVGEQVEGSSFLFDSQVTGPAVNHFQQVPASFWGLLGASIFVIESSRVQIAWQNPFDAEKLFLLKADYTPGDYNFDPLNLAKGKDEAWLKDMKLKELNNGRVAMIAISGMVAQELVNGLNLIPADEVLEMGKSVALETMEKQCVGSANEAACAKAFEAAERAATFAAQ